MTQNQQPATRRSLYEITGNVSDLNTVLMGQDTLNALEDERDRFRDAFNEWADKTDWARKTTQPHELGKHLADVLRERIEKFQAENATLQAGYSAARLEIESLQARIKTMAEEHADELMVAHLDGRMRAAQPAQAEGWTAEQALRNVLAAVQRHMPPDGPDAEDTLSEIIAIVDPWPLGPLEKS